MIIRSFFFDIQTEYGVSNTNICKLKISKIPVDGPLDPADEQEIWNIVFTKDLQMIFEKDMKVFQKLLQLTNYDCFAAASVQAIERLSNVRFQEFVGQSEGLNFSQ